MNNLFDFNKDGVVSKGEKAAGYFGLIAIALVFLWARMKSKESFAKGAKAGKAQMRKMRYRANNYVRRNKYLRRAAIRYRSFSKK